MSETVVVAGATGVVGSGAVRAWLDRGATVIGLSRDAGKLERLRGQISIGGSEPFIPVVGGFDSDSAAQASLRAVTSALRGLSLDHVVASLGFVTVAEPPTETKVSLAKEALEDGLFSVLRAAQVFLPLLRDREGASFTMVSGGLAHVPPPSPSLWLGTLKNASVNALTLGLASETAHQAVRVNTVCVHFSVAPVGGEKNQLGMPAVSNTLHLGPTFVGVARGATRGQVICLKDWAEADRIARDT